MVSNQNRNQMCAPSTLLCNIYCYLVGQLTRSHLMASSFDFYNSPLFKMSFQPATRRIFPTNETWNNYGALLEYSSSNNLILHENLFPDVLMKPANRVQASDDDDLMRTNTLQICHFFLLMFRCGQGSKPVSMR